MKRNPWIINNTKSQIQMGWIQSAQKMFTSWAAFERDSFPHTLSFTCQSLWSLITTAPPRCRKLKISSNITEPLKKFPAQNRGKRERERHAQVLLGEKDRERERERERWSEGRRGRSLASQMNRIQSAIPKQLSNRRPSQQHCSPEAETEEKEQCQHARRAAAKQTLT